MEELDLEKLHKHFLSSTGICIDSRKIVKDCMFVSIVGENFDGNDFASLAIEEGALFALVSDPKLVGASFIYVPDTLKCLQELARFHRDFLGIPILAITGSNGKTTTKELCAQVLGVKYNLNFTKGNLNNHIGVPLTLLSFDDSTEFGIVEMGANHVEEIAELCSIAKPNYGLITNIGRAHIGEFGGIENIKKAKLELFDYLKANKGTILYNKDYKEFKKMESYQFGFGYSIDFIENFTLNLDSVEPYIRFSLSTDEIVKVNLGGIHNVENIKAAIACGFYFGISASSIERQLSLFEAPENRSQWIDTGKNNIFLDAYNANPSSIEMAVRYFSSLKRKKKLIIIGDMFELGKYSKAEHLAIYTELKSTDIEFYLIGENFVESCEKSNRIFRSKTEFLAFLENQDYHDYSILIKASRSMKLETLIASF